MFKKFVIAKDKKPVIFIHHIMNFEMNTILLHNKQTLILFI